MRAVGLSDLDVAARALLGQPQGDWPKVAAQLIVDAHTADVWRKRYGVAHPNGGTGSLYAQASLLPCARSTQCGEQYCAALAQVLAALAQWRARVRIDAAA